MQTQQRNLVLTHLLLLSGLVAGDGHHGHHAAAAAAAAAAASLTPEASGYHQYSQQTYEGYPSANEVDVRQDELTRQEQAPIDAGTVGAVSVPTAITLLASFLGYTYVTNYVNYLQARINRVVSKNEQYELMVDDLENRVKALETAAG